MKLVNKDIELANTSLEELSKMQLETFDVEAQISTTVSDMIQGRIKRIQKEDAFKEVLKQALTDRLPEATWSEIAGLLTSVEMNENMKMKTLIEPFIPKDGGVSPLIENKQRASQVGAELNQNASKEVLQAFDALSNIIKDVANRKRLSESQAQDKEKDQ